MFWIKYKRIYFILYYILVTVEVKLHTKIMSNRLFSVEIQKPHCYTMKIEKLGII